MNATTIHLARRLANQLFAAEEAIDAALREATGLAGLMPAIRVEARVSVAVGQDAIEEAIATIATLGEARRRIQRTHEALAAAQERVGLRERNFGGFIDKPRHRSELALITNLNDVG